MISPRVSRVQPTGVVQKEFAPISLPRGDHGGTRSLGGALSHRHAGASDGIGQVKGLHSIGEGLIGKITLIPDGTQIDLCTAGHVIDPAKHGVIGLTKTAALEAAAQGVRVNAVLPGFAETPMAERGRANVGPEVYAAVEQMHALKRLGTAAEIAEAIVWLLSDASSFVTGSSLLADGGFTAQ